MKDTTKTFLGWTTILLISLLPAFLWFKFGAGAEEFVDYGSSVHSLGEIFGLVGMTLFALTFVLSTRVKEIEEVFGGLDKVYIVHGILGGVALILILFHPIFLVLRFIPQNISLAANYLLLSQHLSTNLGIFALIGLVILVYITLFTKMKYHRWKFTHEFLGLVFLLAVFHIFLVRGEVSGDNIFSGYLIYASVVSFIGLGAFSYSLFLKNRMIRNAVYTIQKIEKNKDTFLIELTPEHKPLRYQAGQFVFIRFYNKHLSKEAHPFSIASKSNSLIMKVFIKKLGDFTNHLGYLNVGDKVSIEGPYGKFNFKNYPSKNQIWVAAGIGVTPFLGMVEDVINDKTDTKIDLYHTFNDESDCIGYNSLSYADSHINGFKFVPWNSSKKGRIVSDDIKKISGSFKGKEFFFCGPTAFKESIINSLVKEGVSRDRIHEEAFDFR